MHCFFAGEYLGSPFLLRSFEEAKKIVDDAYKYSREEWVHFKASFHLTEYKMICEINFLAGKLLFTVTLYLSNCKKKLH